MVRNLGEVLDRRRDSAGGAGRASAAAGFAVALALLAGGAAAATGHLYPWLGSHRAPGLGTMGVMYPEGAVDWIARNLPPARLWVYRRIAAS